MKTSVSWAERDRVLLRGYRIRDLIGRVEFGQAAYLLLVGELPDATVGKIVEAILVAVIDHGPTTPTAKATITVAGTGAPLNAAVAAGVLAVSRVHGGAIEDAMMVLEESVGMGLDPYESATEIVERYRSKGLRVAGIGSRTHKEDPRAVRLMAYAEELGVSGPYLEQLQCLQRAVSQALSRELPINIIGAVAALLCEIKFPRQAANGLFLMSRVAGLVAHAVEEQARYKPLQSAETEGHAYDGPAERVFERGT
jgi:citrate synthase